MALWSPIIAKGKGLYLLDGKGFLPPVKARGSPLCKGRGLVEVTIESSLGHNILQSRLAIGSRLGLGMSDLDASSV